MTFPSRVAGIPCLIRVTEYTPGLPTRVYGTGMGDADPPEDMIFEFEVLDRNGRKADWLAKKLTANDEARIYEEFTIMRRAEELDDVPF